jgi:hypothetical protein
MRAHSQTLDQRPQVGVKVNIGGLDAFQRLRHWFRSCLHRSRSIEAVNPYSIWDAKREQFHQTKADAAIDLVAARNGLSWCTKIYSLSI